VCFDSDSLPPIPPLSGAAVSHEDFVLLAEDGNRFAAFRAIPEAPADVGIVVMPDVRGLYRFYEELALRFAELGYNAVAFDYYGRTAGVAKRDDEFDWAPHRQQTKPGTIQEDVGACVRQLLALDSRAIFTVGFCFGGRHSWLAAASEHGLAGAVGFYGFPTERDGALGPAERADDIECPILALQAGADQNITEVENLAFEAALRRAGVEHELVVYDGAPHSFFDRKQAEFADDSADAWRRVLAFIERYRR
jgi:carboxymethylenebutenolidase